MKYILFLTLLLFLFPLVCAGPLDISLEKSSYLSEETLIAEINVNVNLDDEINLGDIQLWHNDVKKAIAPFLVRISDTRLFVYFDLPVLGNGNTSFLVDDLVYMNGNILVRENQTADFDISGNASVITLSPAVVKVTDFDQDTNYNIRVKNKEEHSIEVSLIEDYAFVFVSDTNFVLGPGEEVVFVLHIDPTLIQDEDEAVLNVYYGDRKYGLYIYLDKEEGPLVPDDNGGEDNHTDIVVEGKNVSFDISVAKYEEIIEFGDDSNKGNVKVRNFGDENVTNVLFSLTGNLDEVVDLNITEIDLIEPGQIIKQYIWINKDGDVAVGEYDGSLVLSYVGGSDSWPMSIVVEGEVDEPDEPDEPGNQTDDDGNETDNGGGNGSEPEPEERGIRKWVIFLIIAIVLAVLVFFYVKKKL